jgi:ABC-2 type transport system ATP-binding protein
LEELSRITTKYGFLHQGKLVQEITRTDLEENCRKCLELELDHADVIAQALEAKLNLKDYKLLAGQRVRIYEEVDIAQVVGAISEAGMKILKINTKNESIEEYYLNLMGGLKND